MALRTSKFILARDIKIDKSYKNVLDYSESSMVTLLQSKAVATGTNLSFIRPTDNYLDLPTAYGTALTANYMAFQNPDYSNKWFFAFIDSVEYITDGTTRVHFITDEFSTWHDNWTVEPCFVIREHVNDDTVGANTMPENIEHGEYISNGFVRDNETSDLLYMLQASEPWPNDPSGSGSAARAVNLGGVVNAGAFYYFANTPTGIASMLAILDDFASAGKSEAITNIYVIPRKFVLNATQTSDRYFGQASPITYDITIPKQTTINGYTPKNNKLLCSPYNFLVLDNNSGTSITLEYEQFSTTDCVFEVAGVPTCGGSIKCVPKNYKGQTRYQQEGIMAGKYPTCGWVNDMYTNWLTQNAVNVQKGTIASVAGIIGGVAVGVAGNPLVGGSLVGSGISGLLGNSFNQFLEQQIHSPIPATAGGNTNGGDINTSYNMNKFYFIKVSIKAEFARQIDDFFTRFGYKVNRLKIPNQTGRQYWNYVQIAEGEDIGHSTNQTIPVPPKSMEVINQVYRNGVTIWHNHDNIGDYTLNNTII